MNRELIPHPLSVHSYLLRVRGFLDLYMESGVLDHLNIAPLNEDTHKPSQLHYGTDIDSIRATGAALGKLKVEELSDSVLNGDNRDEGESSALGCDQKVTEITVTNDAGDSETFFSSPAAFCPTVAGRKKTQSQYPASFFSGKLRLMVQAMYGSKRTDYGMSQTLGNLAPLEVENGSLTWTYTNNNGLFSGRNYEYFMIRVNGSGVYAQKLKAKGAGKKLQEYLQNNTITGARERRYETYLLSTLVYDANGEWTKIGESGDAYSHGSPWYYGWSWNMDGTDARAITIVLKDGEDAVWQATSFKLEISETTAETIADGRLSASVTTVEDTQDFTMRTNEDLVWFNNDIGPGMRPFIPAPLNVTPPDIGDQDVPMYVVYDYENDEFNYVRHKREDKESGGLGGGLDNATQEADPRCSDYACDYYSQILAGPVNRVGFYVDGVTSWQAVGLEAGEVRLQGNEVAIQRPGSTVTSDVEGVVNSPLTTSDGNEACEHIGVAAQGADDRVKRIQKKNGLSSGGELYLEGAFGFECMLVVPISDCDSVYLGRWNDFDGDIDKTGHTLSGSNVLSSGTTWDFDDEIIAEDYTIRLAWTDPLPDANAGAIVKDAAQSQGNYTEALNTATTWSEISVQYFRNGEFTEVHEDNSVQDADVANNLFFPSCMRGVIFGEETPQILPEDTSFEDYEQGSHDTGGFEFDPVLFPEPEEGPNVISRQSANFHSYRATKKPNSSLIDDGTYPYDEIDENLFSYVGFA